MILCSENNSLEIWWTEISNSKIVNVYSLKNDDEYIIYRVKNTVKGVSSKFLMHETELIQISRQN